jgi:hypothetical protein
LRPDLASRLVENPLSEEYDKFGSLVAQGFTNAIGIPVAKSDLAISVSVPIAGMRQPELPWENQ